MERKVQISASVLRGVRNSTQAINRLPKELLEIIFLYTQHYVPSFIPRRETDPSVYSKWLPLLHVCRHWRGVIAACPLMWNRIDNGLMPKTFLRRSGSTAIDVYLGYNQELIIPPTLVDALIPNIPRFRQLHIDESEWRGTAPLYSVLNVPAPELASLTIISDKPPYILGTNILPSLFSGQMPSLKQLTLAYYTRWPSGYFQHLTHLCLVDQCNATPTSRLATSEFLDFLQQSPRLEYLILMRAGPTRFKSHDFPVPPSNRLVNLGLLRELTIDGWPCNYMISRFLSHLSIPNTTGVFIWGNNLPSTGWDDPDESYFLPADTSHLSNMQNIKELWVILHPDPVGFSNHFLVHKSALCIHGHFKYQDVSAILERCALDQVDKLVVHESSAPKNHCFSIQNWEDILKKLPALRTIRILMDNPSWGNKMMVRAILSALFPKANETDSTSVLLPVKDAENEKPSLDPLPEPNSSGPSATGFAEESKTTSPLHGKTLDSIHSDLEILCPLWESLYIERDPTPPILLISNLAEVRARYGKPLKRLEVVYNSSPYPPNPLSDDQSETSSGSDEGCHTDIQNELLQKDTSILKSHINDVVLDPTSIEMTLVPPFTQNFGEWIYYPVISV
ncbi:hypothetical protein VKT23_009941 [Stygiomarasmius scandens]|uniref:F-box domain-containing protein n=1 Tax=Marasmiellus scandens TaxID=2682957 RepID=A0ABR1JCL0_9AGAR